jgi:hypothetical protein
MSKRILLLILSVLSLCGIIPLSTTGCNTSKSSGNPNTALANTKPAIPLIDSETHQSVETAYFALG